MLRQNLWVGAGLTNGSHGILNGFLCNPDPEAPRLGPKELLGGLSIVGISRTKSLQGLMIHPQDPTALQGF